MSNDSLLALRVDRDDDMPLVVQISEGIRRRIVSGSIGQGCRLPSSRNCAVELGVSRSSIVAAYEQLVAEGYMESRRGSGFFVSRVGNVELSCGSEHHPSSRTGTPDWTGPARTLQPGVPDMRLFPYRKWAQCVSRTARSMPESLVRSTDAFGDRPLRESISKYLAEWRGLDISPRQVIVTAGSADALEICIRTLAGNVEQVGLEDPGYLPLRNFIHSLGMVPRWLPVGEDGVEVPGVRADDDPPRLIVLTPSHQFPLGGAMPVNRRMEFLNWAERTGGWIVEDDYDSEFRYAGRPIPALSGFDQTGRTIYIGSFAKIFSGGLRLGFLVAPKNLTDDFAGTLDRFGTRASVSPQRALSLFMDSGEFYRHIRRMRRIYGERRRILLDTLRHELGRLANFEDHQAGMQVLLGLPMGFDDRALVRALAGEDVAALALSSHYAGAGARSGLLLGFCAFTPEEIRRNVCIIRSHLT